MLDRDLVSWNEMLDGCVKHGKMNNPLAHQLFVKMPEKDLVSWNTMLNDGVKHGKMNNSLVSNRDFARFVFNAMPKRIDENMNNVALCREVSDLENKEAVLGFLL
ncbi:hypothetical protein RJT34_23706 [Clitoria ternatea]|uniref:Pentatricopeptide repeat-containing protein n=1 Tax=Clitoria ternatea TaxID=43366 RepID=A0AAN9FPH8_CLITE